MKTKNYVIKKKFNDMTRKINISKILKIKPKLNVLYVKYFGKKNLIAVRWCVMSKTITTSFLTPTTSQI
jgi:hypothetical protein